jgi:hypothetical protein
MRPSAASGTLLGDEGNGNPGAQPVEHRRLDGLEQMSLHVGTQRLQLVDEDRCSPQSLHLCELSLEQRARPSGSTQVLECHVQRAR